MSSTELFTNVYHERVQFLIFLGILVKGMCEREFLNYMPALFIKEYYNYVNVYNYAFRLSSVVHGNKKIIHCIP